MTDDQQQILTRNEVLTLLSEKAEAGSTSAMIALERALRLDRPDGDELDVELDRLLRQGRRLRPWWWRTRTSPSAGGILVLTPREP